MSSASRLAQAESLTSGPATFCHFAAGSPLSRRQCASALPFCCLHRASNLRSRKGAKSRQTRSTSSQYGVRCFSDFKKPGFLSSSQPSETQRNLRQRSILPNDISALENLPSKVASRRSATLKRLEPYMDHLLSRIAVASHAVNAYTGTDFSPISQLREAITQQEELVKSCYSAVSTAKMTHERALASQAASQKEVVQLLERKHSWNPEDLERYMALIRSEHENEQRVHDAKDSVRSAERDLEESRANLEGLERKQYHEEQVWSDNIRRNSTWVTFGLMGVNIVLLLASLVVIEPWRRKRLVREIKGVLAEEKANVLGMPQAIESRQLVDAVSPDQSSTAVVEKEMLVVDPTDRARSFSQDESVAQLLDVSLSSPTWMAYWHDLFSDRHVALRRVDLTKATLQGVAAGAASMGLLCVLLRPR